jgi:hypothetical protein
MPAQKQEARSKVTMWQRMILCKTYSHINHEEHLEILTTKEIASLSHSISHFEKTA